MPYRQAAINLIIHKHDQYGPRVAFDGRNVKKDFNLALKILLVEDDETFYDSVALMLSDEPVQLVWAETGSKGIQTYRNDPYGFALVISDYRLPDMTGTDVCRHVRHSNAEQIFLFTSKYFEPDFLKDQLRAGGDGFVDKTAAPNEMRGEFQRAINLYSAERRLLGNNEPEKSKIQIELEAEGFIGRSPTMYKMLAELRSARETNYPTLIVGETGTGKELVARALTKEGKKLVAVNCASYINREHMLESELFGYVKGAFTDAKSDTPGLVQQAKGQTFYLDELHQLPIGAQSKLLRFFQEMTYRRVGDNSAKESVAHFDLIASVQPDIKQRLKDGRFLPDLLERVGALIVNVPALRDRPEDIEPLVKKFQDDFNESREASKQKQFRISTVAEMRKQLWPTNVRGLQNAVKRMLTNCSGDLVNPKDFKAYLDADLMSDQENDYDRTASLDEARKSFESKAIVAALRASATRVEAAARLKIPITNLLRRLEKFEINADLFLQSKGRVL